MALKEFLALTDKSLAEKFDYVAPDLTKARKPFIAALDKAAKQFGEGKQPRGANALWSANNNVVRFTPKLGGAPVSINGETVHEIEDAKFPAALKAIRDAVEAGELDEALHDASESKSDPLAGGVKLSAHSVTPKRAGWSAERRQRYEATQAAKKAAKAAK